MEGDWFSGCFRCSSQIKAITVLIKEGQGLHELSTLSSFQIMNLLSSAWTIYFLLKICLLTSRLQGLSIRRQHYCLYRQRNFERYIKIDCKSISTPICLQKYHEERNCDKKVVLDNRRGLMFIHLHLLSYNSQLNKYASI